MIKPKEICLIGCKQPEALVTQDGASSWPCKLDTSMLVCKEEMNAGLVMLLVSMVRPRIQNAICLAPWTTPETVDPPGRTMSTEFQRREPLGSLLKVAKLTNLQLESHSLKELQLCKEVMV